MQHSNCYSNIKNIDHSKFFDPTTTNYVYKLNDLKFEVLREAFVRKLEEPRLTPVGRSRVNYIF